MGNIYKLKQGDSDSKKRFLRVDFDEYIRLMALQDEIDGRLHALVILLDAHFEMGKGDDFSIDAENAVAKELFDKVTNDIGDFYADFRELREKDPAFAWKG